MLCPKCKTDEVYVIDSRDLDPGTIRRRRECSRCHYRFTTYERSEKVAVMVIKRDGRKEAYDRQKVIRGLNLALEKRGVGQEEIEAIADKVETRLIEDGEAEVPSRRIGHLIIKELRKIDEVAYLRFISVFKSFKSIKSFEQELEKLKQ